MMPPLLSGPDERRWAPAILMQWRAFPRLLSQHRRPDVLPYEHRGSRIRTLELTTDAGLLEALEEFHAEPDRWLRKMLAQAILASGRGFDANTREELTKALACRIS